MDDDGLGFPNIELSAGSSVEGCLYMIKQEELDKLDACVGYPEVIYSGPSLSGHSQQRQPSLMWPQCFGTTSMNAFTSPSRQRPPL